MFKAAQAHGRPTIVIAMITAAISQPAAIQTPPKTSQRTFRRSDIALSLSRGYFLEYLVTDPGFCTVRCLNGDRTERYPAFSPPTPGHGLDDLAIFCRISRPPRAISMASPDARHRCDCRPCRNRYQNDLVCRGR